MRTFEHPNLSSDWKCPICGLNEDKEVVLIGISGTEDDGNMKAEQFHFGCINLVYLKDMGVIAQRIKS